MHRTLLLCFIHGFKGDDNTFGGFPEHLRTLIGNALPNITIKAITYPKFDTRGDLLDCVSRLREWLQNQVIDLEVAQGTQAPTIDPSVHVVLIGHSMGGIVAAETLLAIANDEYVRRTAADAPLPSMNATSNTGTTSGSAPSQKRQTTAPAAKGRGSASSSAPPSRAGSTKSTKSTTSMTGTESPDFMFPYITGVLAFDTPFLGISPGVLAYGAETHYKTASSAYNALSSAAGAFGWGSEKTSPARSSTSSPSPKALLAGPEAAKEALSASADAAAAPAWQRWGKIAMFAGAAGAVVAGGTAAYLKRDTLQEGWGWASSHLEFVGCLVRGEEMKQRVGKVLVLSKSRGIGFSNMVTVLGKGAGKTEGVTVAGGWVEIGGNEGGKSEARGRTFCTLPRTEELKTYFEGCVNDKAPGEIDAHVAMFFPRDNPGYYEMSTRAKRKVVGWVDGAWYRGSTPLKRPEKVEKTAKGSEKAREPEQTDEQVTEEELVMVD